MSDSICNEHAPTPHNEEICHATGQKRKNIIDKLIKLLDEADERPCIFKYKEVEHSPPKSYDPFERQNDLNRRNAIDRGNPIFMKKCPENGGYQTQRPAKEQFRPRQEEQKGEESVYKDCICLRANGLQDQCPVLDCKGREECVAVNPGPCCKPALSRLCEMQQQKKQRAAAEAAVNYSQNGDQSNYSQNGDHLNYSQNGDRFQEDYRQNVSYENSPKKVQCFCYYG